MHRLRASSPVPSVVRIVRVYARTGHGAAGRALVQSPPEQFRGMLSRHQGSSRDGEYRILSLSTGGLTMVGRIYFAIIGDDLLALWHSARGPGYKVDALAYRFRKQARLYWSTPATREDERTAHASLAQYRVQRS